MILRVDYVHIFWMMDSFPWCFGPASGWESLQESFGVSNTDPHQVFGCPGSRSTFDSMFLWIKGRFYIFIYFSHKKNMWKKWRFWALKLKTTGYDSTPLWFGGNMLPTQLQRRLQFTEGVHFTTWITVVFFHGWWNGFPVDGLNNCDGNFSTNIFPGLAILECLCLDLLFFVMIFILCFIGWPSPLKTRNLCWISFFNNKQTSVGQSQGFDFLNSFPRCPGPCMD